MDNINIQDMQDVIVNMGQNINEMDYVYSDYYDEEADNIPYARGMSSEHVTTIISYFNVFKSAIEEPHSVSKVEFEVVSRRIIDHAHFSIKNVIEFGHENIGKFGYSYPGYWDDDSDIVDDMNREVIRDMEHRIKHIESMREKMGM